MIQAKHIQPITKDDAFWFQALFNVCFNRNDPWLWRLDDQKYEAFHIDKQAFVFTHTVEDVTDLLILGVHPDQRNKGFATSLLAWIIAKAPNGQKFLLDVECQNDTAISLYKKMGFVLAALREGHYPQLNGPALDAFVMAYRKPCAFIKL